MSFSQEETSQLLADMERSLRHLWQPPHHQDKASRVPLMSQFLHHWRRLWRAFTKGANPLPVCTQTPPLSPQNPRFSWDLPSLGIKRLRGDPRTDKPGISWLFYISRGNDGINLGKVHLVKWKIEARRVSSNTIIWKLGKWVFMKHRRNSIHSDYQKKNRQGWKTICYVMCKQAHREGRGDVLCEVTSSGWWRSTSSN